MLYDAMDEDEAFERGLVFDKTNWGGWPTTPRETTPQGIVSGGYTGLSVQRLSTVNQINLVILRNRNNTRVRTPRRVRNAQTYDKYMQNVANPEVYRR